MFLGHKVVLGRSHPFSYIHHLFYTYPNISHRAAGEKNIPVEKKKEEKRKRKSKDIRSCRGSVFRDSGAEGLGARVQERAGGGDGQLCQLPGDFSSTFRKNIGPQDRIASKHVVLDNSPYTLYRWYQDGMRAVPLSTTRWHLLTENCALQKSFFFFTLHKMDFSQVCASPFILLYADI